jgi:hypothetical protein
MCTENTSIPTAPLKLFIRQQPFVIKNQIEEAGGVPLGENEMILILQRAPEERRQYIQ